jgi:hypothetical protein
MRSREAARGLGRGEGFDVAEPPAVGGVAAPVGGDGDQGEQQFRLGLQSGDPTIVFGLDVGALGKVPRPRGAQGEGGDTVELAAEGVVQGDGLAEAVQVAFGPGHGDVDAYGVATGEVGDCVGGVGGLGEEGVGVMPVARSTRSGMRSPAGRPLTSITRGPLAVSRSST